MIAFYARDQIVKLVFQEFNVICYVLWRANKNGISHHFGGNGVQGKKGQLIRVMTAQHIGITKFGEGWFIFFGYQWAGKGSLGVEVLYPLGYNYELESNIIP